MNCAKYDDILSNGSMRNSIFSLETIEYSPLYKIKRNFMFATQLAGKKSTLLSGLNKIFGAIKLRMLNKKKLFALMLVNNEFNKKLQLEIIIQRPKFEKISVLLRNEIFFHRYSSQFFSFSFFIN